VLRGLEIARPNQVAAMDITYIPMARGLVYFAGMLHRAARRLLRSSSTPATGAESL
jgi:putative transposase